MYNNEGQNIVAIATPPGVGAIAVIRISGKNLFNIYKSLTHNKPIDRYALFSKIYHPENNKVLDESIITYFKSPNSYTGEDVVEISCHGGLNTKKAIIGACLSLGIKNAERGEFSYRAYINGKIDLIQAEAISSLISSRSSRSTFNSLLHLDGKVSENLNNIKKEAVNVLAIIENELNFSEDEISHTSYDAILKSIEKIGCKIRDILKTSTAGKKIFSGIRVALLGQPNAGKSTLFNSILGENRALTSSEAGTTRDTVESWFELEGVPICLIDTAGIWEAASNLDKLGVEKTLKEIKMADICLLLDEKNPEKLLQSKHLNKNKFQKYILIKSKSDLLIEPNFQNEDVINISSKNNTGIKELLTEISSYIVDNVSFNSDSSLIMSQRQFFLLEKAMIHINRSIDLVKINTEADIVASTLHGFVDTIREVVGEIPNKEIINKIFNDFCVGK